VLWQVVWALLFRPSPKVFHGWRRWLLRLFGARIGFGAHIHPSVKIWAPWNLEMSEHSCLGPYVDCYNVAPVSLGPFCTVSQYTYLCAATHDYTRASMPLVARPIQLGARSWIAAQVFIGPGVTVGEGAVIGARSLVLRDVEPWVVAAGSPARVIKTRPYEWDLGWRENRCSARAPQG
jgi:putative colanic acid biosynthesis acetyltransferase WcaF